MCRPNLFVFFYRSPLLLSILLLSLPTRYNNYIPVPWLLPPSPPPPLCSTQCVFPVLSYLQTEVTKFGIDKNNMFTFWDVSLKQIKTQFFYFINISWILVGGWKVFSLVSYRALHCRQYWHGQFWALACRSTFSGMYACCRGSFLGIKGCVFIFPQDEHFRTAPLEKSVRYMWCMCTCACV